MELHFQPSLTRAAGPGNVTETHPKMKNFKKRIILQIKRGNTMGTDSISLDHSQARKRNCVQFFFTLLSQVVEISCSGSLGLPQQSAEQRRLKQHIHCLRVLEAEGRGQSDSRIVFLKLSFEFFVNQLLTSVFLWPYPCVQHVCWLVFYSQNSSRIRLGSTQKIQLLL